MELTTLLEIKFAPFIPTTILGLLGLISGYLYFYFKNKDDNKLKAIQSTNPDERLRAIEVNLNELGVPIKTDDLTPSDKYKLLVKSLNSKTRKYLIIASVLIILSAIFGFLIYDKNHLNPEFNKSVNGTSTKTILIRQDKVQGDKVQGDKVAGDKINGDKIINK